MTKQNKLNSGQHYEFWPELCKFSIKGMYVTQIVKLIFIIFIKLKNCEMDITKNGNDQHSRLIPAKISEIS